MVVTISDSREILAPIDRVWEIVADVDNDPKYWHINGIHNISRDGNVIEREVTVGFRNSSRQTVVLTPKQSIEVTMTEGRVKGKRLIMLNPVPGNDNKTRLDISWNIELSGIPLLGRSFVKSQFKNTTKEALDRIANAVN